MGNWIQSGIHAPTLSPTGSPGGDGVGTVNRKLAHFLNLDTHFADRPQRRDDVMRGNALALFAQLK